MGVDRGGCIDERQALALKERCAEHGMCQRGRFRCQGNTSSNTSEGGRHCGSRGVSEGEGDHGNIRRRWGTSEGGGGEQCFRDVSRTRCHIESTCIEQ
jgi:hypothetical protein